MGLPYRLDGAPGRTNGLVNGKDTVRGSDVGRPRGMVNSHTRPSVRTQRASYLNTLPLRRNPFGVVTHSDLRRSGALLAVSLAVILVLGYLMGTPVPVSSPFAVDGDFSEWSGVPLYDDPADMAPGEVDLISYGVHDTMGHVFVYGKTRAALFPSAVATSVYLVIDGSTVLGYQAPGMEADYIAEMWGWDNAVTDTVLRQWTADTDRDNATSFRAVTRFPAIAVGNEFELAIREDSLAIIDFSDLRIVVAARSDDVVDLGATIGLAAGSLVVEQRPLTKLVAGPSPLVELRLRALATDVRVDGIATQQTGGGSIALPAFPFVVTAGTERVETLTFDPGTLVNGSFVTVRVAGVTAQVSGGSRPIPVTISGDDARAYVQGGPSGKVVDGLFDDWVNVTPDPADPLPAAVDIRESAASFPSSAFFYLRTEGRTLSGAFLPELRNRPVQTVGNASQTPVPLRRIAGEDVLRIYIDTNSQDSIGVPLYGISADRWVEVRGRLGRITSTALYTWNPIAWSWERRTDTFTVAFVGPQLEAEAAASFLGSVTNPRVVFAMSDWSDRWDQTAVFGPTFVAPAPPAPQHGFIPDSITATPLTGTPTVDGRCPTSLGEYAGASLGTTFGFTFQIGRRDDTEHVYICIDTDDTTNNVNDFSEIVFDTKHNGGLTPQPDDRLFWIFTNDNNIGMAEGDGLTWVICGLACDPSNIAEGRFRTGGGGQQYEYRIRYTDIWGTLTPPSDAVAGFAVFVWDDNGLGQAYGWGSNFLNDSAPETWGHLFIPEFPIDGLPFAGLTLGTVIVPLVILRRTRARRRRTQG